MIITKESQVAQANTCKEIFARYGKQSSLLFWVQHEDQYGTLYTLEEYGDIPAYGVVELAAMLGYNTMNWLSKILFIWRYGYNAEKMGRALCTK